MGNGDATATHSKAASGAQAGQAAVGTSASRLKGSAKDVPEGVDIIVGPGMGMTGLEKTAQPTIGEKIIRIELVIIGDTGCGAGLMRLRGGLVVMARRRTETGVLGKERCTVARRTVGSPQTVATLMTGRAMGDIVACHGRVYRLGKARDGGKQERHQQ